MKNKHCHIKKIVAVDKFFAILFDNGRLYVIGKNNAGVFGTRENPLIIDDRFHQNLAKIVDKNFKG